MPHSERPNTPEDPTSDQYLMYRLEHDLYELFEEQQVLLDIVAQQQEQRSNESQRVVVTEPPARHSTPVPEENRIEAVPERAVAVPSKLLAIGELNEQTDTGKDTVPPLPPLPPPRCICNQRRNSRPFLDDIKGAKCTPPKRTGLGYDTPFPYPKRMAKTRERRALFIFTVVDNMMLQLQRCMSLAETGAPPMPKNSSSVTIVELDALTNEPVKRVNTSTGTVPKKPNVNPIEKVVKRSKREKGDKRLHKKAGKEAELLAIEIDLDCEFGMEHIEKFRANRIREDDHSVYRTSAARKRKRENTEQQQQMITSVGAADADGEVLANALASLTINEQTNNNVQLVKPQPQSMALIQPQSGWYGNGMANIETQQDTRPCTPEVTPFAMLPQALHANNFLNQMPSTSAQARALSMAMSMSVHPDSLRSSLTPSPSTIDICSSMSVYQQQQQLQYQQQQQQQQQFFPISPLQTVPVFNSAYSVDRGFVSPITPLSFVQGQNVNGNIGMPPIRSINGNDLNAPTYDGCRLNYVQDIGNR